MSPDESCGQSCLREKKLVPGCNTLAYRKGNQTYHIASDASYVRGLDIFDRDSLTIR